MEASSSGGSEINFKTTFILPHEKHNNDMLRRTLNRLSYEMTWMVLRTMHHTVSLGI
jgi:hypothetical protein